MLTQSKLTVPCVCCFTVLFFIYHIEPELEKLEKHQQILLDFSDFPYFAACQPASSTMVMSLFSALLNILSFLFTGYKSGWL